MQTCLDKRVTHQSWAEGQLKTYYPDNSSIPPILNCSTSVKKTLRWSHLSKATLRCNTQNVFIMPRLNRGAITECIVNVLDQHAILVLYTVHLSKIRIMSLIEVVTGRETPRLWSSCLCCCGQPNTPTALSPRQNPGWRD